eukprot:CAMPEP_0196771602 /NCGR_PEP_ID=MMETSP1104-20130614/1776_1 /TAXON_ID=33652 /ORGANISM="Cafeteria sp., Strain Caron Lab Isolate" /LENGTH=242 /DNA_ID=CAMNT_0042141723 /DNA_START=20 /DNA_END=748 /DNA_ORIENTATION=-
MSLAALFQPSRAGSLLRCTRVGRISRPGFVPWIHRSPRVHTGGAHARCLTSGPDSGSEDEETLDEATVQKALEASYAQVQHFLESMAELQRKDHIARESGNEEDRMDPQARMMTDWLLAMHNKSAVSEEHLTVPFTSVGELLEEADLAEFLEYSEGSDGVASEGEQVATRGSEQRVQMFDHPILSSDGEESGLEDEETGSEAHAPGMVEEVSDEEDTWSRPSTYEYTDAENVESDTGVGRRG